MCFTLSRYDYKSWHWKNHWSIGSGILGRRGTHNFGQENNFRFWKQVVTYNELLVHFSYDKYEYFWVYRFREL